MSSVESVGNLNPQVECFAETCAALRHSLTQRFAFDKLGDDKVCAVEPAYLVNGNDIRMVECRYGSRFLLEATQSLRVYRELNGQQFERNLSAEPGILRQIHFSHATFAEQVNDLVWPNRLPH